MPVVGFDASHPGFFWLAGQGGYGFQTSSAIAELAAVLLTGADPADLWHPGQARRQRGRDAGGRAGQDLPVLVR